MHEATPTEFTCTEGDIREAIRKKRLLYHLSKMLVVSSASGLWEIKWEVKKVLPTKTHLGGLFYKNYWLAFAEARRRNEKLKASG